MKDYELTLTSSGANSTGWVSTMVISAAVIVLAATVFSLAWVTISPSMPIMLRVFGV